MISSDHVDFRKNRSRYETAWQLENVEIHDSFPFEGNDQSEAMRKFMLLGLDAKQFDHFAAQ
jgi:hypothetical protein